VIEIDPGVTQVAYDLLGLSRDTEIVTYNQDARLFLFSVPYHLTTKEFNDRVRAWLEDDGLYVVNIIDGPWGHFLRAYTHTLRQTFRHVYVAPTIQSWRRSPRSTFVLIASDTPLDLASLETLDGGDGVPLLARRLLSQEEMDALMAEGRVVMLTDQYAPVEQMLAPVFLDRVPK
jgi:hypothetical protein